MAKNEQVRDVLECECAFFELLPEETQKRERSFRKSSQAGYYDVLGIYASMCGSCVILEANQAALDRRIAYMTQAKTIKDEVEVDGENETV